MKIRQGFVSNSSTTSFCIYGTAIEHEQATELFEKQNANESATFDYYSFMEKLASELGLEFHFYSEAEIGYLGRSWDTMGDNETGKQFKDSINTKIKSILGDKAECETIEQAWRDG